MAKPTDYRNQVEILGEDFLERKRAGEQVTVQEYVTAHPDLADEIRRLFRAMLAMERFKACSLTSSGKTVELHIEGLEQLGDYRIIREIGRGGMGVVYEAEQQSLGRRVAVKVFPKRALRDSRHLERFYREARTAASLHHTNIVPVFGVGEQDGLHYYVMQRIEGIALDEAMSGVSRSGNGRDASCDKTLGKTAGSTSTLGNVCGVTRAGSEVSSGGISVRQLNHRRPPRSIANPTVELDRQSRSQYRWIANVGIQVAEAVAYAHAQGVLHRDIKPSNLLLDPHGIVWITDFGLATVLQSEKPSDPDDVAGTLRFMAPEHLSGEQDARSDIYSLGLTLYELLTSQPAFEDKNRARLIEKILSGEPARPRSLRPDIPRDLEAIVLKAIAREPKRRYENAGQLANDLHRFVEGRPVDARQVGSLGQLRRWTGRNPAIAALSAALLIVAFSSFALISEKWREAVAENRRAEDNLSLALESMDQILERFASSWLAHPSTTEDQNGESTTSDIEFQMAISDHSAAVLQDALKFYDRFAEQNASNPQLQRDTAKVHRRVGDIYERLGEYGKAEQAYKRSLAILDSKQVDDDDATLAMDRASTRNQLGLAMYATSRFDEAEKEFHRAKEILSVASLKDNPKCQAELARTYNNLGQALALMHRRDECKRSHQHAVELLEALVQEHPDDTGYRVALARAYRIYYPFALWGSRFGDHRRIRTAGIAILEQLVSDFPNVPDYQCELSEMLTATSFRPRNSNEVGTQAKQLQRAVTLARQISESHPSIARYRAVLARTLKDLGRTLTRTQRDEADKKYVESVSLYHSLTQDFADIPAYHTFLANALHDRGENLRRLGRMEDARLVFEQCVEEQQAYVALRPENHFGTSMLAHLHEELAKTLISVGANDQAEKAMHEAEQLRQQLGIRGRGHW